MLTRKDIRKAKWWEEASEYFDIDRKLLQTAVAEKRLNPEDESKELKKAREEIRQRFMNKDSIKLHDKILHENIDNITDIERSSSWKNYIFLCINSERRCFQRMAFYESIISCVVKPLLKKKDKIKVLDYGCGSSLFTRMLSQDFVNYVETISMDVCKPAVEFSIARNKLYNQNGAHGIIIKDVMSFPEEVSEIDIALAYVVFEHLPNSTYQIRRLINSLSKNGILIENYSGFSQAKPHKSDTFNSYKSRDKNLDLISNKLSLIYGHFPNKKDGIYEEDGSTRFWIKGADDKINKIRNRLKYWQYYPGLYYRINQKLFGYLR